MEPRRRDYLFAFTVLGLAVSLLMGFQYIGGILYSLADAWVMDQGAGGMRWLSWLFHSSWTGLLVQYVFVLGAAYPLVWLILRPVPKYEGPGYPLSLEDFAVCLAAAMGIGYVFSILGNLINLMVSVYSGKSMMDMNPVADMVSDLSPSMVIYACLLGPLMEELMFRGMLLKRARVFGDRTAVVYTALLFGMMHGNLNQFLYATAIGLVLGYAAVKTGRIRHTVVMHVIINSFGMLVAGGEILLERAGMTGMLFLYDLAFLAGMLLLIVGAVLILCRYTPTWYRQLTLNNGAPSPFRKYVYLNPGFFLYLGICGLEMAFYLF